MKLNLGFLRAPKSVWVFWLLLVTFIIVMVTFSVLFSAIPWAITFLEVGRVIGPIPILEYYIPILFVLSIFLVSFLMSKKLNKHGSIRGLILALILYLMISSSATFSFSLAFMPQVSQAGRKIDTFVRENGKISFGHYVENVTAFLNNNLGQSYNRPEASFMINRIICSTIIDPHVMRIWGVSSADLILYQEWGSCGEAAILIEELLHGAGYETRLAHFKNIDHEWAEVKHNETWWMVDPWYIGKLVEVQSLKGIKPAFQNTSGVEVQYRNGTVVDVSLEHGY